jgi:hypothetical protein
LYKNSIKREKETGMMESSLLGYHKARKRAPMIKRAAVAKGLVMENNPRKP